MKRLILYAIAGNRFRLVYPLPWIALIAVESWAQVPRPPKVICGGLLG